eukprot:3407039-Rhodomonas_salina.1
MISFFPQSVARGWRKTLTKPGYLFTLQSASGPGRGPGGPVARTVQVDLSLSRRSGAPGRHGTRVPSACQ